MKPAGKEHVAVIVTTIAAPNRNLEALARGCRENDYQFIVVGDEASPPDFHLEGCRFYALKEQYETGFKLAPLCSTRHYARKNLGYLIAIRDGATLILETDDDNIPYEEFWHERWRRQRVPTIANGGWVNIYRYFSDDHIWPRGFPLEHLKNPAEMLTRILAQAQAPLKAAGLSNEDPDVDAIYRLTSQLPQSFRTDRRVAVTAGSWCPFNSQNTAWWRAAFPLLYLPAYCSFRMTDIWRSFAAQRIAWTNEWGILFHDPTAGQQRNEHNLLRDFEDEVPGYLHNAAICEALGKLSLPPGIDGINDNLRTCYEELVKMCVIATRELDLLEAWICDLNEIQKSFVRSS